MPTEMAPRPILTWAIFVATLAALLALRILPSGAPLPDALMASLGNDSAMRLISVRDLLAGQGWFDPMQMRLGPEGTPMHWSRLIDGPMAAFLLLLEPLIGMERAEYALLILWPTVIAAALVAFASAIGRALAGGTGGLLVLVVTFLSLPIGWRSAFGDIDHHTVQLLLLFIALHGFLYRGHGAHHAAGAGLAIAASLCIGVETLPLLMTICLTFAVVWLLDGLEERRASLAFALGLGGGFATFFALTAPPMAWHGGFCDAASIDLGLPFVGGAVVLGGLAYLISDRSVAGRAVPMGIGIGAVGILSVVVGPACLSNPYDSLDPYLVARWLEHVSEAQNIWGLIESGTEPRSLAAAAFAVAMVLFALAADRRRMALPALLLAVAIAIAAYQVRGSLHMMGLAAIVGGATLALIHAKARATGSGQALRMSVAGMITVIPFAFSLGIASGIWSAITDGVPDETAEVSEAPETCKKPSDWAALATLPPGRVAASVDFGTPILRETNHSVLSAPYHRNEAGMVAILRIATATDDAEALERLRAMEVDYIAICPTDYNLSLLAGMGEIGFMHHLWQGNAPDFLSPLPGDGPVRLWRVDPAQS